VSGLCKRLFARARAHWLVCHSLNETVGEYFSFEKINENYEGVLKESYGGARTSETPKFPPATSPSSPQLHYSNTNTNENGNLTLVEVVFAIRSSWVWKLIWTLDS
jgi:hypothetical protein